jgi:hypothetical protein
VEKGTFSIIQDTSDGITISPFETRDIEGYVNFSALTKAALAKENISLPEKIEGIE